MKISEAYLDSLRNEIISKLEVLNRYVAIREQQLKCDHVWVENECFSDPSGDSSPETTKTCVLCNDDL